MNAKSANYGFNDKSDFKFDVKTLLTFFCTTNRILKNKPLLIENSKTINGSTKRDRSRACAKVEKAFLLWFNQIRE